MPWRGPRGSVFVRTLAHRRAPLAASKNSARSKSMRAHPWRWPRAVARTLSSGRLARISVASPALSRVTVRTLNGVTAPSSSFPEQLFVANNTLFFITDSTSPNPQLWRTDGTPGGTELVDSAHRGAATAPVVWNGLAYFANSRGEILASDGTPFGTVRLSGGFSTGYGLAPTAFTASAIASVVPDRNSSARKGFEITRPTAIEVYAIGELSMDEEFDYGWIIDVDSNKRVWSMDYADTDPAGGAVKNRMAHETLQLKPGHYVAYFACDDSHSPDDWTNVPATDPEFWGLTLRVADPAARASVRPYEYEPVPQGQTIVSLIGIRDDEMRSAGFALRRPMDVHIYAIGEGFSDRMADYAWIVDEEQHKRVWAMNYRNTEHAGGAAKNRVFDGTIHLAPGNYLVYYKSDGSHSYNDWNGAAPAEPRYWGVSVFPASRRLNPADLGPFLHTRGAGNDATVAQLTHMSNDEDARTTFSLTAQARVRVLALGEGRDDEMNDYGWIEDGAGRTVWTMKYADTEPAGGADKNRVFDGVITLPAGSYVLRYRSDGSHSYGDWNANPPDDPESWGIAVFRTARR